MQLLDRAFKILELYLEDHDDLSLAELSELSGLSRSVTHRIVSSLQKKGYIVKEKKGKYSLGFKFLNYAYIIRKKMKTDMIMPYLKELNKKTDEAVMLGNADKDQLLVIDRVDTAHALNVSSIDPVGRSASLHCTSIGKLFLSQMSDNERRSIYRNKSLKKYTKYTITDFKKLEKEFEIFKKDGCIYEREEYILGIWSVAAPVYGLSGQIEAGLSILVPTARLTDKKIQKFSFLVKLYAMKISQALNV